MKIIAAVSVGVPRWQMPSGTLSEYQRRGYVEYDESIHGPIPEGLLRHESSDMMPHWYVTVVQEAEDSR